MKYNVDYLLCPAIVRTHSKIIYGSVRLMWPFWGGRLVLHLNQVGREVLPDFSLQM